MTKLHAHSQCAILYVNRNAAPSCGSLTVRSSRHLQASLISSLCASHSCATYRWR